MERNLSSRHPDGSNLNQISTGFEQQTDGMIYAFIFLFHSFPWDLYLRLIQRLKSKEEKSKNTSGFIVPY